MYPVLLVQTTPDAQRFSWITGQSFRHSLPSLTYTHNGKRRSTTALPAWPHSTRCVPPYLHVRRDVSSNFLSSCPFRSIDPPLHILPNYLSNPQFRVFRLPTATRLLIPISPLSHSEQTSTRACQTFILPFPDLIIPPACRFISLANFVLAVLCPSPSILLTLNCRGVPPPARYSGRRSCSHILSRIRSRTRS